MTEEQVERIKENHTKALTILNQNKMAYVAVPEKLVSFKEDKSVPRHGAKYEYHRSDESKSKEDTNHINQISNLSVNNKKRSLPAESEFPPSGNSSIYALECQNNKWYIGKTNDVKERIEQHLDGHFADEWTNLYPPIDFKIVR